MLPTGELLVFSVTSADAHASYRCRTVHHVTGSNVESSSFAHLVVTGKLCVCVCRCVWVYTPALSAIKLLLTISHARRARIDWRRGLYRKAQLMLEVDFAGESGQVAT